MEPVDLAAVPGTPESALPPGLAARLGPNLEPAPWDCRAQAVFWVGRGGRAATAALAGATGGSAAALAVLGGMVRYLDTPVGAYDEVFGAVAFRRGGRIAGNVPFMAVDSEDSVVGGRANWSLPKTVAAFAGRPTGGRMEARGSGWQVTATTRPLGPAVPVPSRSVLMTQQWPDGRLREAPMRLRGRARPALVTVTVESAGALPHWLRAGRYAGVVFETLEFALGTATAARV